MERCSSLQHSPRRMERAENTDKNSLTCNHSLSSFCLHWIRIPSIEQNKGKEGSLREISPFLDFVVTFCEHYSSSDNAANIFLIFLNVSRYSKPRLVILYLIELSILSSFTNPREARKWRNFLVRSTGRLAPYDAFVTGQDFLFMTIHKRSA